MSSTNLPTYSQSFDNLNKFMLDNPNTTSIKFVFYLAHKLHAPLVRSEFRKYKTPQNNIYYLVNGIQPQFIYAYKKSDLEFLLTYPEGPNAAPTNSKRVSLHPIQSSHVSREHRAYAGNHIDFGCISQRNNDTLFKVHYTWYDDWFEPLASRSYYGCNYRMSNIYNNLQTLETFKSVYCIDKDSKPIDSKCSIFGNESDIVYALSRVACGYDQAPNYIIRGGNRYKCYKGSRGGRYIKCNGKKRYLQKGGNPSILDNNEFLEFISIRILHPLSTVMGDRLNTITIIYDEGHELSRNIRYDMMLFKYEIDDLKQASFYYVDASILKTAFYALNKLSTDLTNDETKSLKFVNDLASIIVNITIK